MKYKLIKKYPGSPEINSEGYKNVTGSFIITKGSNTKTDFVFENYPQFWEKVVDKEIIKLDYEVISLITRFNKEKIIISYENQGGTYNENSFKCYKNKNHFVDSFINSGLWKINSVKRLSDGQIFALGDNLQRFDVYESKSHIEKINSITIVNKDVQLNSHYTGYKTHGRFLNDVKFIKPLFTTEDGVDIFKDIKFWYIDNFKSKEYTTKEFSQIESSYKTFSTLQKCAEYILINKPCLSLNDVKNCKGDYETVQRLLWKIEELVKQKLK